MNNGLFRNNADPFIVAWSINNPSVTCSPQISPPVGDMPPAEFEQAYYNQLMGQATAI